MYHSNPISKHSYGLIHSEKHLYTCRKYNIQLQKITPFIIKAVSKLGLFSNISNILYITIVHQTQFSLVPSSLIICCCLPQVSCKWCRRGSLHYRAPWIGGLQQVTTKVVCTWPATSVYSHLSLPDISPNIFPPVLPISFCRIRTKIVDPYNKIVARTAQLARLQVCFDMVSSYQCWECVCSARLFVSGSVVWQGERLTLHCLIISQSRLIPVVWQQRCSSAWSWFPSLLDTDMRGDVLLTCL